MTARPIFRVLTCVLTFAIASADGMAGQKKERSRPVKIGVLASLTGSWSSLGQNTVAALRIAAKELKADSQGRFQLVVHDTQLDPNLALAAIKKLHRKGVRIVIGPQSSSELAMIKPFADSHKMLVISQGSTASSLAVAGDNIFRFCPNDKREALAIVALMRHDGISTLVPLWRNDAGNNGLHDSVTAEFESGKGGIATEGYRYEPSTTDFSTATSEIDKQIQDLVANGTPEAEIAVYCAAFDEIVDIFHNAQSLPALTGVAWYGSDGVALSAALVGDAPAAELAVKLGYPNPIFGLKDSLKHKWEPVSRAVEKRTGITPDAFALSAYDALFVTSRALKKAKVERFPKFRRKFVRQANRYKGVTGSTALDAAGDRQSSDFDFWSIRSTDQGNSWIRTGTYHDGVLTVF